ncbi:hypothetical protein EZV62_005480 [Acer yangbiense]|uniref:Ubiquinol-cytochrome c chaperone domain-containing protein n=1 Tax=Acer yangbiense TaxID=1000413 RepID=A0A5C7IMY1_9ROSI|nr:hypothetical protein EZV62_005480 [Acer yangbiense]
MFPRWSRALGSLKNLKYRNDVSPIPRQTYSMATASAAAAADVSPPPPKSPVNLDKLFWSKPCSLALPADSPHRMDEPNYEGFKRIILKLMLFYSKQSKSIRGANVIYRRVVSQVDKPLIYDVFNLEKTFKMTFSLLVLHMWFCLRRLKEEGKEGVELGQYLYELYNHDVELRVSKAGVYSVALIFEVNLLLSKWMKELERIFYGNIVAYDAAMLPEAKKDELQNVIWRNVFCDDGTSKPDDAALRAVQVFSALLFSIVANHVSCKVIALIKAVTSLNCVFIYVQAMTRYVRREVGCLSLTDKEAMFSGNFMFTPLENTSTNK